MLTTDDLDGISYLPCIRSRRAELKGYKELRHETKNGLVPLVALGKLNQIDTVEGVLRSVKESIPKAFIDLNLHVHQHCSDATDYCNPGNNYSAWRSLFDRDENYVPVAVLPPDANVRSFVRQVVEIERSHGIVAIRSRNGAQDLATLQAAIAAVGDVNNVLFILDFGYIRGATAPRESEARRLISALRGVDPETRIALVASSFPRSVSAYGEESGVLDIEERDLHAQVGGQAVAIYGDHSSIYPEPFEPSRSRFVPRIDYCLTDSWIYRRFRDSDQPGYVRCANAIVNSADWDPAFTAQSWGAQKIQEATAGVPAGFGAPANWIAARVNMHIERQFSASLEGDDEDVYVDL